MSLTKQCGKCFCFLPAKVMFKSSSCPLDKWITVGEPGFLAITNPEENRITDVNLNPFLDSP